MGSDPAALARPLAKLLIIEDDSLTSAHLAARLRRLGYAVVVPVLRGAAVVRAVALERPDVVLINIALAGERDALTAAEQIRARHGLPVIFLTADFDPDLRARAQRLGPAGFLSPSYRDAGLLAAVELALSQTPRRPPRR